MDKISRMWELSARKDELWDRFIKVAEQLLLPYNREGWAVLEFRKLTIELQEIVRERVLLDAEILKLTDCQPLLEKAGRELHDLYQRRYPITKNTRFIRQPGIGEIRYYIPENTLVMTSFEEMPATIDVKVGVTKVETIAAWGGYRIRLAYAPEIDTIFWSEA